jgi:hypothetical protein
VEEARKKAAAEAQEQAAREKLYKAQAAEEAAKLWERREAARKVGFPELY